MSYLFEVADHIVWDVSQGPARLYLAMAKDVSDMLGVPTGISEPFNDACEIDRAQFGAFVEAVLAAYGDTNHAVFRDLLGGVIRPSLVLAERIGFPVDASSDHARALLADARTLGRSMAR
ncbi:DUF6086 family protein [Kribbella endophytica]